MFEDGKGGRPGVVDVQLVDISYWVGSASNTDPRCPDPGGPLEVARVELAWEVRSLDGFLESAWTALHDLPVDADGFEVASTMEADVEAALEVLLEEDQVPDYDVEGRRRLDQTERAVWGYPVGRRSCLRWRSCS